MTSTYKSLARDGGFRTAYNEYQRKYADEPKESDKVILSLVADALDGKNSASILDIGCSTGNLLRHLSRAFPSADLTGGDLAESSLAEARKNAPGANFEKMDLLNLPKDRFDIIIASAMTVYFTYEEYDHAIYNVARSLKDGGTYIAFEWISMTRGQDLRITETTPAHPEGLKIYIRPFDSVERHLKAARLSNIRIIPFEIPIDLPLTERDDGVIATHTVRTTDGHRLSMRGAWYQPWAHLVARKT